MNLAVEQLVSKVVFPTEVPDILGITEISKSDISVLSDKLLKKVKNLQRENLAFLAALRKMINYKKQSRNTVTVFCGNARQGR